MGYLRRALSLGAAVSTKSFPDTTIARIPPEGKPGLVSDAREDLSPRNNHR